MAIYLHDNAVKTFKNMIDVNHDNILTPDEVAHGINVQLVRPIADIYPGIEREMLHPENLRDFMNEQGTIDDDELKVLLEQYLDFLAESII